LNGASLQIPQMDAENRITKQIQLGKELLHPSITNEDTLDGIEAAYRQWTNDNIALLNDIIDTNDFVQTYVDSSEQDVHEIAFEHRQRVPIDARVNKLYLNIDDQIIRLETILARLDLYPESQESGLYSAFGFDAGDQQNLLQPARIFIAHGHDDDAKQTVARYIEKLGFEPIILEEQPNQGRTIIEKFEASANVAYVIVLLTPDDLGRVKLPESDELSTLNLAERARQNVIFELGYFFGKLGRHRTCALVKGTMEFPSDISGILWVRMDLENNWKFKLAQEMRAAGLAVDLNRLV